MPHQVPFAPPAAPERPPAPLHQTSPLSPSQTADAALAPSISFQGTFSSKELSKDQHQPSCVSPVTVGNLHEQSGVDVGTDTLNDIEGFTSPEQLNPKANTTGTQAALSQADIVLEGIPTAPNVEPAPSQNPSIPQLAAPHLEMNREATVSACQMDRETPVPVALEPTTASGKKKQARKMAAKKNAATARKATRQRAKPKEPIQEEEPALPGQPTAPEAASSAIVAPTKHARVRKSPTSSSKAPEGPTDTTTESGASVVLD